MELALAVPSGMEVTTAIIFLSTRGVMLLVASSVKQTPSLTV